MLSTARSESLGDGVGRGSKMIAFGRSAGGRKCEHKQEGAVREREVKSRLWAIDEGRGKDAVFLSGFCTVDGAVWGSVWGRRHFLGFHAFALHSPTDSDQ